MATGRDLWEGLARPALARLAAPLPPTPGAVRPGEHAAVPFLREIAVGAARRMWAEREARAADLRQRILRRELALRGERTTRELQLDALTGLGNRRRLEVELAAGGHHGVLFIDLDHFKQVNDTFGHTVGDEVLRRVAAVLRQCCRDDDVPVRYGGDEFVVLLGGDSDGDGGAGAARRLGARVLDRMRATDWSDLVGSLPVSVSVGAARGEATHRAPAVRRGHARREACRPRHPRRDVDPRGLRPRVYPKNLHGSDPGVASRRGGCPGGRNGSDNRRVSLYRDEGVVLRAQKLGEADRIVTLLTREHGRVRAVAKGVRRTTSRFGARLEPFS